MTDAIELSPHLLAAAARNCGEGYAFPTARSGLPHRSTDLFIGGDLGLPVGAPPNSATLLRPPDAAEVPGLLADLRELFSGPGGGWQVWDPWAAHDLHDHGFAAEATPIMVRPPGGAAPPLPEGLRVAEVLDEATVADLNCVLMGGYGLPDFCAPHMYTPAVFGDPRYRAWVGYVDDRPVSTATAYVGAGLVGVYAVATLPTARGHGYGEALSWAATLCAPDLPGFLQASAMGRPVYERMGYLTIAEWTIWSTERAAPVT